MSNAVQIDGGTFASWPNHEYRSDTGVWVPSLTQVLKLQGLSSYRGIAPEIMKTASERGTAVHDLTDAHDRYGEIDPSWLTPGIEGYFKAYLKLLQETGFVPDKEWIERALVANVFGCKVGMKLDRRGKIGGQDCILEIKCTAARQASWAYQTAGQEMGVYKTTRCGQAIRLSAWLRKDGTYRLDRYEKHQYDAQQITSALINVYGRLDAGQKLWEEIAA